MFDLMLPRRSRLAARPSLPGLRGFDDLFEELWRGFGQGMLGAKALPGFSPRIDVRESEDEIVVTAELAGLEEKDFEVSVQDGVLTLEGEKRSEETHERAGYRHVETRSGRFERRVRLPAQVDEDAVKARFKDGVLTVTVPKPAELAPEGRRIPVTSA